MENATKIVILNWNGVEHLRRFLPSVVATTPSIVSIVVADNGSTDNSIDWVRANYPNIELVCLDRNYGYAEGYNRALKQVVADYYILLNSDVEPCDGWCDALISRMDSDADIAALAPKILAYSAREKFEYAGASGGFIDMLGYPFCRGRVLSTVEIDGGQYDAPVDVFWASGACFMVRSELFHRMEGFDADFFAHMEEIDLCWRLQLAGHRVAVEPASVVYHLGGGTLPNNTPRKLFLNFRNNLSMLYKNLPEERLMFVLLVRMVLDGCSAFVYLAQGKLSFFKAVWDAHREFQHNLPQLKIKRAKIMANRTIKYPKTIFCGSVVLRYVLGYKTFSSLGMR